MKLFQGGMSWDEVATTLGVSNGFLYRVRNIYLPNTIRQKNKWTQETDKMCISLSQRGASFAELYEALPGYSRDYIRAQVVVHLGNDNAETEYQLFYLMDGEMINARNVTNMSHILGASTFL